MIAKAFVMWLGAILPFVVIWWWGIRQWRKSDRVFVEEFARIFPGRCMICSYHRYGYDYGHEKDAKPPSHHCIEVGR